MYKKGINSLNKALSKTVSVKKKMEKDFAEKKEQKKEFLAKFDRVKSKMKADDIEQVNDALKKMEQAEKEMQELINRLSHNKEILENELYSSEQKHEEFEIKSIVLEEEREDLSNDVEDLTKSLRQFEKRLKEIDKNSEEDDAEFLRFLEEQYQFFNDGYQFEQKNLEEEQGQLDEAIQNNFNKEYIDLLKQDIEMDKQHIADLEKMMQDTLKDIENFKKQQKDLNEKLMLESCPCDETKKN